MRPGKGLGKEEKGIAKPIRCGLKFDKAGIGYNEKISKEESMRWWEQVYDQTASKIFTTVRLLHYGFLLIFKASNGEALLYF